MNIKRYNESGDVVFLNDKKIRYDDDAYAFIITDDKIYFSRENQTHMEIMWEYGINIEKASADIIGNKLLDNYFGRIWIDQKIISFWNLKTNDFVQTLKDIQKEFYNKHPIKIDFFDGEWLIDVDEFELSDIEEKLDEDIDDLIISEYEYYSTDFYVLHLLDYIKIVSDKGVDKEMDEKSYKLHLLDAKKKREELKKMGYKSKTRETSKLSPVAYRDTISKYQFTEKFNSFQKLNENPNRIGGVFWTNEKTLTFSYYFGKFFFDYKKTHFEMWHEIKHIKFHDLEYLNDPKYEFYNTNSGRGELTGRLFLESKIISFWRYPEDNKELKKVADDIKKHTGIDIWTDEWKIEVLITQYNIGEVNWQGEVEIIPVKDYVRSGERSEEELRISHTDDPQEKERKRKLMKKQGKEVPKGYFKSKYDIPAKFDYMRRKYMFQEKFSNFQKLNENPNEIEQLRIYWNDDEYDPYVFGYYHGDFYIQHYYDSETHEDLWGNIYRHYSNYDNSDYENSWGRGELAGRLWEQKMIISFWYYPKDKEELKKVAKDIQKYTGINIWKDDWKIEVIDDFDEIPSDKSSNWNYSSSIIPIKDYVSSAERSEEELRISHTDDPQEKERKRQLLKQQGKEGPKDIPAKFDYYRRKHVFQENFNNFLNENPDYISELKLNVGDGDAYPFTLEKYGDDFSANLGNKGNYHVEFEFGSIGIYPGRLWLEEKVISFWVYPKKHEMNNVLKTIQKSFKIKHDIIINFNDGWIIEVLKNVDEFDDDIITSIGIDNLYLDQRKSMIYKGYREVLIPLEEYTGSLDQPEEVIKLHLLDAKRKREELKKMGYKSKTRETSKLPPAIYRDDITKYKFTEKFNIYNKKNK